VTLVRHTGRGGPPCSPLAWSAVTRGQFVTLHSLALDHVGSPAGSGAHMVCDKLRITYARSAY